MQRGQASSVNKSEEKTVLNGSYCSEAVYKYEGGPVWKNLMRSWLVPETAG
jgi:hypothetical protein